MNRPVLSARLHRHYVQKIRATPEEVFPLLCPEMEKAWLPGWQALMIHSASGLAERGAVFAANDAIWIITEHDSPRRVAFARFQADGVVVLIEITLSRHLDGSTAVGIAYAHTPTDESSRAILAAARDSDWLEAMQFWEGSMNAWFDGKRDAAA
jgi:hypothetical protein